MADNLADTSWCAKLPPRLSIDGTDEWLTAHIEHPNIRIYRRQLWPGKNAMVNAALSKITKPCALMQVDADEFWSVAQLARICSLFETGMYDRMRFFCRFYVGEKIVVTSVNTWGNRQGEWQRAWLFRPGMVSLKHEPPIIQGVGPRELTRERTKQLGLVFEHEAYKYIEQVEFKERYYNYPGAVEGWKRLQKNKKWPVKLKPFFHWVEPQVVVDKI